MHLTIHLIPPGSFRHRVANALTRAFIVHGLGGQVYDVRGSGKDPDNGNTPNSARRVITIPRNNPKAYQSLGCWLDAAPWD